MAKLSTDELLDAFKQKTAYEIGTGDSSSDVCSSDLFFGVRDFRCVFPLADALSGRSSFGMSSTGARRSAGASAAGASSAAAASVGSAGTLGEGVDASAPTAGLDAAAVALGAAAGRSPDT